jgi:PPM family protein phosphatase
MTGPHVRSGAATDVGLVRDHNEDSMIARGAVFAVADGMGGHAAGEVASGLAVEALGEIADRDDLVSDDVTTAVGEAHARILRSAARHPEQTGMGTTLTGLAAVGDDGTDQWAVFNVGDSRVYRFADGQLTQVTVDHSEVRELVDAGLITPEQAAYHPLRNIVTQSLGASWAPQVDLWVLPRQPGERFLVCSDGLSGELSDREIAALLARNEDPQEAATALVEAAVAAGGRDNVTVVMVVVEGVADRPS